MKVNIRGVVVDDLISALLAARDLNSVIIDLECEIGPTVDSITVVSTVDDPLNQDMVQEFNGEDNIIFIKKLLDDGN